MKKKNVFLSVAIIVLFSFTVNGQKKNKYDLDANKVPDVLHVHIDDFPEGKYSR